MGPFPYVRDQLYDPRWVILEGLKDPQDPHLVLYGQLEDEPWVELVSAEPCSFRVRLTTFLQGLQGYRGKLAIAYVPR